MKLVCLENCLDGIVTNLKEGFNYTVGLWNSRQGQKNFGRKLEEAIKMRDGLFYGWLVDLSSGELKLIDRKTWAEKMRRRL